MCRQVARIEVQETAGELGALLLESELIKQLKPLHNKRLRRQRRLIVAQSYHPRRVRPNRLRGCQCDRCGTCVSGYGSLPDQDAGKRISRVGCEAPPFMPCVAWFGKDQPVLLRLLSSSNVFPCHCKSLIFSIKAFASSRKRSSSSS